MTLTLEKPPSKTTATHWGVFEGGVHKTAARAGKVGSGESKEEWGHTTARSHGTSLLKKLLIWNLSLHEAPASGISEASVLSRDRLLSSICYGIKSYTLSAGSYFSKIKLLLKFRPYVDLVSWFCLIFLTYCHSFCFKVIWRKCTKHVPKK